MLPTKLELTALFLVEARLLTEQEITESPATVKQYMNRWWVTPCSFYGLNLTRDGHMFLSTVLKLPHHQHKLTNTTRSMKLTLRMNKYLSAPFYLSNNVTGGDYIVVYGKSDSLMLVLHGGDLGQYMENFAQ